MTLRTDVVDSTIMFAPSLVRKCQTRVGVTNTFMLQNNKNYEREKFYSTGPWTRTVNLRVKKIGVYHCATSDANVIKKFTEVIYCFSTVIPSFCVIK